MGTHQPFLILNVMEVSFSLKIVSSWWYLIVHHNVVESSFYYFGKIFPCHFYHVVIQNNSTDVIFFKGRITLALITYYLISVLFLSLKTTITYVI